MNIEVDTEGITTITYDTESNKFYATFTVYIDGIAKRIVAVGSNND